MRHTRLILAAALATALGLTSAASAAQEPAAGGRGQGGRGGGGRGQAAGPTLPASLRPPAVTPAPNQADPFAAIKAGAQTPVQYQAQFRYAATVDPLDPFHNWGGNLWNQTWEGQWLAAQARGQTFEQF